MEAYLIPLSGGATLVALLYVFVFLPIQAKKLLRKLTDKMAKNTSSENYDSLLTACEAGVNLVSGNSHHTYAHKYENDVQLSQLLSAISQHWIIKAVSCNINPSSNYYTKSYSLHGKPPWWNPFATHGEMKHMLLVEYRFMSPKKYETPKGWDACLAGKEIKSGDEMVYAIPVVNRMHFIGSDESYFETFTQYIKKYTFKYKKVVAAVGKAMPFMLDITGDTPKFRKTEMDTSKFVNLDFIDKAYMPLSVFEEDDSEDTIQVSMKTIVTDFLFALLNQEEAIHVYGHGVNGVGKSAWLMTIMSFALTQLQRTTGLIYINVQELMELPASTLKQALLELKEREKLTKLVILVDEARAIFEDEGVTPFKSTILNMMEGAEHEVLNSTFIFAGDLPFDQLPENFKSRIQWAFGIPVLEADYARELFQFIIDNKILGDRTPLPKKLEHYIAINTGTSATGFISLRDICNKCFSTLDERAKDALREVLKAKALPA